jgi:hypothetical protein
MWIRSHLVANSCFCGFFYLCTKIEQIGFKPETAVNIGSMIFHQQSYTQAATA